MSVGVICCRVLEKEIRAVIRGVPEVTHLEVMEWGLHISSRGVTWDQSTLTDATVEEDIDPALVRRFLLAARSERRWDVPDETSVERVLRQLGLIQDGKLTVAAVLLFGRNPQRLLTQAMVRCARFKGTKEVHFLDMKVIQGSIIDQVEEVMAFIKRNTRMAAVIKGLHREERWEYPLEGLREAVVNAISGLCQFGQCAGPNL
jgi:ATP-dependent DNA helicase RecG